MIPQAVKAVRPIKFTKEDVRKHIKPLLVFSISVIASFMYTVFDKTLLGIMSTKENVAFYEYSNKIVNVPKTIIGVTGTVMFPRACRLAAEGNVAGQKKYIKYSYFITSFLGMASLFGLMGIADTFSIVYYGESFKICGKIMAYMAPLYLSDINMNDSKYGANFGYNYDYHRDGISVKRYSDPEITWEKSAKTNFALEFTLFNDLNVTAEYYTERRKSILQQRASIPASMGLWVQPYANLGEAKGSGVDLSLDYNKYFANKSWLQLRGNFTYATSEYMVYEDYEYPGAWWKQKVGYPTNQTWGYIAEGLFVDDNEVANSPVQFGEYGAGDIKYRDVNKDGKITDLDQVPIGYPKEPEIVYGFGPSIRWKNLDFSFFFQGVAKTSLFMSGFHPFGDNSLRNVLQFVANDRWSPTNQNVDAKYPRLTRKTSLNNTNPGNSGRTSDYWMRDGSFLKLKNMELGYTFKRMRFYISGSNLLTFSKFDLWDPEQGGGSGLKYPTQRVFNVGFQMTFNN